MNHKGRVLLVFALLLSLCLAGVAQGRIYSLAAGSGAQLHIGNGLALPIQAAATVTGMAFPPLLIPVKANQVANGTTSTNTQQRLAVAKGVLSKAASGQNVVGVLTSNPTLYAVGTNLQYTWPAVNGAVFSTGIRTNATQTTTYFFGTRKAKYSPGALPKAFGGAAQFRLTYPNPSGLYPTVPVTVYAIAGGDAPPCIHTVFSAAGSAGCRAAALAAYPAPVGAIGGPVSVLVATPGAPAIARTIALQVGTSPTPGSIIQEQDNGPFAALTNMATSRGYPLTAGKIELSAPAGGEAFTLSGTDLRGTDGAGTLQMVGSSLSKRALSGDNANRGWVRLILVDDSQPVPSMAPMLRAGLVGLLALTAAGYLVTRRRQSA